MRSADDDAQTYPALLLRTGSRPEPGRTERTRRFGRHDGERTPTMDVLSWSPATRAAEETTNVGSS
jgi:hypothetical protein